MTDTGMTLKEMLEREAQMMGRDITRVAALHESFLHDANGDEHRLSLLAFEMAPPSPRVTDPGTMCEVRWALYIDGGVATGGVVATTWDR